MRLRQTDRMDFGLQLAGIAAKDALALARQAEAELTVSTAFVVFTFTTPTPALE